MGSGGGIAVGLVLSGIPGMRHAEGLAMIDAKRAARRPPGRVGEVDGEGRDAARGDADVQATGSAVVIFPPLLDRGLAQAVGQDSALAGALGGRVQRRAGAGVHRGRGGNLEHGSSSEKVGTMAGSSRLDWRLDRKGPAVILMKRRCRAQRR